MEVAIVVIVVFVIVLLLVIVLVRLCTKYSCIGCCDSDADSLDDEEDHVNEDNQSDCGEEEQHPQAPPTGQVGLSDMGADLEACCYEDEEEELTQGSDYSGGRSHDYSGLSQDRPIFRGGKLQMEDDDGEEFLINKMEESLL